MQYRLALGRYSFCLFTSAKKVECMYVLLLVQYRYLNEVDIKHSIRRELLSQVTSSVCLVCCVAQLTLHLVWSGRTPNRRINKD